MKNTVRHFPFMLGFLISALLLSFAFYLELYKNLQPCPLCEMQRLIMGLLSCVFLLAYFSSSNPAARKVFASVLFILALLGVIAAGRQVWLQSLPADQVPVCGASLEYIVANLPFSQALMLIFKGSGNCAKVTWTFLGLSIPKWTLLAFIVFAGLSLGTFFKKQRIE